MPEVQKHRGPGSNNGTDDYPEIVGQTDDRVGAGVDVKYRHEEREGEGKKSHNGEHAHRLILFRREERIIRFSEFVQRLCGAHDVIVDAIVVIRNGAEVRGELRTEHLSGSRFKISQDLAVWLNALPQIKKVARAPGYALYHLYLMPGKYVVFDGRKIVQHVLHFVLHSLVEIPKHVKKHVPRVIAEIALFQNAIDLKNLRKFMQGVDRIVMSRNKKIAAHEKIDLLLAAFVAVSQRREVKDEIGVIAAELHPGLGRREEELLTDEGSNAELIDDIVYLVAAG